MRNRNFNAVSIDGRLHRQLGDGRFAGRVHSIFQHAINIELDGLGLITIVPPQKYNGPGFIKACPFPSLARSLRVRSRALATGDEVVFHSAGVRVSLEDARLWRGKAGIRKIAGREELLARKSLLAGAIEARRGVRAAVEKRIDEFSKTVSSGDPRRIKGGLGSLMGLGDGLTPAGDDVLLGLVCFAASVPSEARPAQISIFIESFSESIEEYRDSTTFISYSLLRYGCEGRFVEPLSVLCRAVLADGNGGLEGSLRKLLGIGAESGRSMLRGVTLGLELLLQE